MRGANGSAELGEQIEQIRLSRKDKSLKYPIINVEI